MGEDQLSRDLETALQAIPIIDPHSHIDPRRPTARNLDEILGYHYYTELAHSAGMDKGPLSPEVAPRERVRAILSYLERIDNTVQYSWFLEIARTFLGFQGDRITAKDCDTLWNAAERVMAQPDWEEQVLRRSNLEKIFLTNDFDDPLEGFDTARYVPCLRTDDLVFHLGKPEVRQRLAKLTGMEVGDSRGFEKAIRKVFEHFVKKGARACAISLPPDFMPNLLCLGDPDVEQFFFEVISNIYGQPSESAWAYVANYVFTVLVGNCRDFRLPFDLMIGVNRRVYRYGVNQGQDLFDQRTSLIQFAELFNTFPEVTFPISVLSSGQNQELVSFSWIFPNVVTSGHWWYSNIPAYIETDCRARLQAVPKTKQIGYYSDAYKLEFVRPKYNMYRRILARILADDFVRPGIYTEEQAIEFAQLLLRDNARRIFGV
jgi:glucuronate isomerase